MKISLTKVLIMLLLYIDATFSETIEITRIIQSGKWRNVVDSFHIPQSVCNEESSGYGDYCNTSCTIKQDVAEYQGPYSCACTGKSATVTFLNNTWRCLGNEDLVKQLGCKVNPILFLGKKMSHRLYTLNTARRRKTVLNDNKVSCSINTSSSWYIGCFGEKVSLGKHTNRTKEIFLLEWIRSVRKSAYFLKVQNHESIDIFQGRVINLGISCSNPPIEEGCLLFKLEGSVTCPVEMPTLPSFSSSITPTTFSMTTKQTASSSATKILKTAADSVTVGPTQAFTEPNSGGKQKKDDDSSSSPLGIIAGVTVSITLVLLLIGAFFIYRRRKSGKDHHTNTAGQTNKGAMATNPKTNCAFRLEKQKGFITNNDKEQFASIYTSDFDVPQHQVLHGKLRNQKKNSQSDGLYAALNIPEGHNIYGPGNGQEEIYQKYGSSSADQPVYNVLEGPSVKDSEETANKGPYEPEPVYNVLEEPYAEGSEGPAWYGSMPVDGPVYNTLEEPDQYAGSSSSNEPVYNVLEAPDHGDAGEADRYGTSDVQDPVYNVLEGPDPEKSSEDGLYSNSLESQNPGGCNNIPVYAVVNKKKK